MTAGLSAWSNEAYAKPGVEPLLIALQDQHRLNVNIILWCLWCSEKFEEPQPILLRKAADLIREWSTSVVGPLRTARRALKNPPPQASAGNASALQARLKEDELAAERIEQEMLEALASSSLRDIANADIAGQARRNLAAYARLASVAKSPGFSVSLLEELIALIFPSADKDGVPV